jgi:hypothetical protein
MIWDAAVKGRARIWPHEPTLERQGFIAREPGKARSIRPLLSREELPDLE